MMNSFWWGTRKRDKKSIHWLSQDKLIVRKELGGGILKHLWFQYRISWKKRLEVHVQPRSYVYKNILSKILPKGEFSGTTVSHNLSYAW